jgi:hypothetical protein
MEGMPPRTARGHTEPYVTQFSIFLANRVGQLRELLDLFEQKDADVLGVSIVDSTDWAVIRTIFSNPTRAREILAAHKVPFTESPVLLVEVPAEGGLAKVAGLLVQAEVNVHFAWPLALIRDNMPVMVFHVDDNIVATQVLGKHGLRLFGDDDIADEGA